MKSKSTSNAALPYDTYGVTCHLVIASTEKQWYNGQRIENQTRGGVAKQMYATSDCGTQSRSSRLISLICLHNCAMHLLSPRRPHPPLIYSTVD